MGPKFEFRISFPTSSHSEAYVEALQKLVEGRTPTDERTDAYLVTPPHFGLKERNGEKLELKVREKDDEMQFEYWSKTALTCEDVSSCHEEVAGILIDKGYPTDHTSLEFREKVALKKGVCKVAFEKVNFEVTRIAAEDGRAVNHQEWVSVVVEGKKAKHVHKFLTSAPETSPLRAAIDVARQDGSLLPAVAGYPMFVRQLVGACTPEDLAEMQRAWTRLTVLVCENDRPQATP